VAGHRLAGLSDIIVTNRHVAEEFGRRRGAEFVSGRVAGAAMTASIDFSKARCQDSSAGLPILPSKMKTVLTLAFLRVELPDQRWRVDCASAALPQLDETVAVIGIPRGTVAYGP
jgi:hypothetical protein